MRAQILRCALSHFSRDGFEATSLRTIADELDVSVPTLRNYFGSKDGLLVATLERLIDVVDLGVQEIVSQGLTDPERAVRVALSADASNRALSRDLMAHVIRVAATEPEVTRIMNRLRSSLEAAVVYGQKEAGGRQDVEASRLAQILADLIIGAMVDWVQSPETETEAHTEVVVRTVIDLIVPRAGPRVPVPAEQVFEAMPLPEPVPQARGLRSELQNRILDVAHRLFAAHGVRETSLDAIADELSISQLTIFYHFGSKDGLLAQLAVDIADVIDGGVADVLAEEKDSDLREGIALIPRKIGDLPDFGPKLSAEILRVMVTHPDARMAARRIHGAMARLVAMGQDRGIVRSDHGPVLLARIILDLTYGGLLRWIQDPTRPVPESALDTMRSVRLFLRGDPSEARD
ncbi:MAG: TetR/AcrR family transcriptional regulator [Myxococcales bacterium]|nr:TetR/AcrR family transcriptional regulator [Myxococcales bacterium]